MSYHLRFASLLLIFASTTLADINNDVVKCRQSESGPGRAACFRKLIPHLEELSKQGLGNTSWAESLKEAYEATAQFAMLTEAERRVQIDAGAEKLFSTVLAHTNNKTQAYAAVVQYFQALGSEWEDAAKHAERLGKLKDHNNVELPPAVKTQLADAIHAVQPRDSAQSASISTASKGATGTGAYSHCLKSVALSDEGNSSGRHLATVTIQNTCSQTLNFNVCIKSERAQCWTCKTIPLKPGQSGDGPSSAGFGECTSDTCTGVSVVFNATPEDDPPKPNVDACYAGTR